jgi:hypothetical protein
MVLIMTRALVFNRGYILSGVEWSENKFYLYQVINITITINIVAHTARYNHLCLVIHIDIDKVKNWSMDDLILRLYLMKQLIWYRLKR